MSDITFADKVEGAGDGTGKLSAADVNEIKTAVNSKADDLTSDQNYVTDAEKTVIGNTSGTNTGDQNDHGGQDGLADDDHTQYSLLAGRASGQTIVGGSGVEDTLVLQGTSGNGTPATKSILLKTGNNGDKTGVAIDNTGSVLIETQSSGGSEYAPLIVKNNQSYASDRYLQLWKSSGGNVVSLRLDGSLNIGGGAFTTTGSVNGAAINGTGLATLNGGIKITSTTAKSLDVSRNTTANTAGPLFTISGSGATSGATDKSAGGITLTPGVSTGTGKASITVQRDGRAGATGTADNAVYDALIIPSTFMATAEGNCDLFEIALPTLTMAGGKIDYQIIADDGTDVEAYSGTVLYSVSNKAGTYYNQITPRTEVALNGSAGAITPTWSIVEGTDKVTIRCAVACSTITATAIRIYFVLQNGSRQAITLL